MLIAVIADTHMTAAGRRALPPDCRARLEAADLVLHAGDIVEPEVLCELEAIGPPVAAVHGNMDVAELRAKLPRTRLVEAEGALIGMVHDPGPPEGRLERLRRRFPEADAVVFGHTHLPEREVEGAFQIFNPGSPTERRRAPRHAMGLCRAEGGSLRFEHVVLEA